jgi:hypothetical protein
MQLRSQLGCDLFCFVRVFRGCGSGAQFTNARSAVFGTYRSGHATVTKYSKPCKSQEVSPEVNA